MCLIVYKPAKVTFDEDHLRDFYLRNQDGFGVMYAEGGILRFAKELGSVEDWLAFYKRYEDREAVFHLRMQTHGLIDLENAHPYDVFGFERDAKGKRDGQPPLLLMHNGILNTGNSADTARSDTWHYIRDYLRPMLRNNEAFAMTPQFRQIIGKHIGDSNRFVLMDAEGTVQIVNRSTGVEYKGAWFSNTYAWSAYTYMKGTKGYTRNYSNTSWGTDDDAYAEWDASRNGGFKGRTKWNSETKSWMPIEETASTTTASGAKIINLGTGDTGPKSKNQLKKEAKRLRRAEARTRATGQETSQEKDSGTSTGEVYVRPKVEESDEIGTAFHKTDAVPIAFVDDVLEMRSILEVAYPDATTKDSQLVQMLQEMTVPRAYKALELLIEGKIKTSMWDHLTLSVRAMRGFARIPDSTWEKVPKGRFGSRSNFIQQRDEAADEHESAIEEAVMQ